MTSLLLSNFKMPTTMRKPTKAPPPPPLPPHPLTSSCQSECESPPTARSCCSLYRQSYGAQSEYGGYSVHSMPIGTSTLSTHPLTRSPSSTTYQSCHSESAIGSQSCCYMYNPCSNYSYEASSGYSTCCQSMHHGAAHSIINGVATPLSYTNNNSMNRNNHMNSNHNSFNLNNNNNIIINDNMKIINNNNINRPRTKISRPILSVSPMPKLEKPTNYGKTRSHLKCNSFYYRRYIEQHVMRIFNYLEGRHQRRLQCEAEVKTMPNAETILQILAKKESRYLRSLRTPMTRDDFQFISPLGCGFIGNVCLVRRKSEDNVIPDDPAVFAMKKLKKSQVFQQNHMAHIMAERDILAEADNDWIVKLYYSFQDNSYLYFILEFVPGGDMMNLLSMKNVFSEDWARFYIAEISLAVQFVHDMGFIHRDIKPDNILIDAKGHIKLTDFGLCTGFRWTHDSKYYKEETINSKAMHSNDNNNGLSNDQTDFSLEYPTITNALAERQIAHAREKRTLSLVGSPNYIAPEVLRQALPFNSQDNTNERLCDWWSVGVILYEMVIGYCPFIDLEKLRLNQYSPSNDPPQLIQDRIVNWKKYLRFPSMNDQKSPPLMQEVILGETPSYAKPKYIEPETKNLIEGLLRDPHDRLCQNGIIDIQNHPFFNTIDDWQTIRLKPAPYVPYLKDEHDTSHFSVDQINPQLSESDNQMGSGTLTNPVNDFTYKSFWQR